jgi:hypothetical protein
MPAPQGIWAAIATLWLAIGLAVMVCVTSHHDSAAPLVGGMVMGLAFMAAGVGMSLYARGCLRAGISVAADGVIVANPLSRRAVSLSDIKGFSAGVQSVGYGGPTPGIVLDLVDGSHVRVWALAREGLVWTEARNRARWHDTAESLNNLLASVRPTGVRRLGTCEAAVLRGTTRALPDAGARSSSSSA